MKVEASKVEIRIYVKSLFFQAKWVFMQSMASNFQILAFRFSNAGVLLFCFVFWISIKVFGEKNFELLVMKVKGYLPKE